jgi:hypothetical protein
MAAVEGMGGGHPGGLRRAGDAAGNEGGENGQENPVDTIFANKFYETQSHLMLTGHIKGAELVVFNEAAWQALARAAGASHGGRQRSQQEGHPDDIGESGRLVHEAAGGQGDEGHRPRKG